MIKVGLLEKSIIVYSYCSCKTNVLSLAIMSLISRLTRRCAPYQWQSRFFASDPKLTRVFFDIEIDGKEEGRVTFEV